MNEQRLMAVAVTTVPAHFGNKSTEDRPAQPVIAAIPALGSPADGLDNRKAGFNPIGAAQEATQARMHDNLSTKVNTELTRNSLRIGRRETVTKTV